MNQPAEIERGDLHARPGVPDVRDRRPCRCGRQPSTSTRSHQRALVAVQRGRRRQPATPGSARPKTAEEIRTRHGEQPDDRLAVPEVHELEQRRRHGRGDHHVLGRAQADALGVPEDRWVFPHSGADCHEHPFVSQPLTRSPARRRSSSAARRALELAGLGIDDIDDRRPGRLRGWPYPGGGPRRAAAAAPS